MVIEGWKAGARSIDAIKALQKHTSLSLKESKSLIEQSLDGKAVRVPDDFVLREDLEDAGFIVR